MFFTNWTTAYNGQVIPYQIINRYYKASWLNTDNSPAKGRRQIKKYIVQKKIPPEKYMKGNFANFTDKV